MKSIAVETEVKQPLHEAATPSAFRQRVRHAWLVTLFWCARHAPWLVLILSRPTKYVTARYSRMVIDATHANARRILGEDITLDQQQDFARRVVGRFCDFVLAVGQSAGKSASQLRSRIESIEGKEAYLARRQRGGGAIIVTAHMGSFELGLAALTEVEKEIHVIFKRDAFDAFESLRRQLRETLGIHEAAIDDGWKTWMNLRDALLADHVIVLQGDRAMPGQKSEVVPFLGGHLRLPLGPLKMALASGSPIIPIFTVMSRWDRCKVFIEPAIEVDSADQTRALHAMASSIEKFVKQYPDQWLVLNPAFVEDEIGGGR